MTNQHDTFEVRAFALDFEAMRENPTWAHEAERHDLSAPDEASAEKLATSLINMGTKNNKTIYLAQVWTRGDNPRMLNEFE